jgi:hypothetical protein
LEVSNVEARQFYNRCHDNGFGYGFLVQSQCGRNQCRRCSAKGSLVVVRVKPVPSGPDIDLLTGPPRKGRVSSAEITLREIPEAARSLGLQIQVLNASTSREIEEAFAILVRERADDLFVAPDSFFQSRRVQFATLTTRHAIPAAYSVREYVEWACPDFVER